MGIYATHYVVFGFSLDKKQLKKLKVNYMSDKFMPYIEGHRGIEHILVYDRTCDDYIVFGKEIYSQGQHEQTSIKTIPFNDFNYQLEAEQVTQKFIECIGQETFNQLEQKEPQLLVFTHYS